ncbi:DUF4062 domain-containing protein [Kitasatospora sp. NPDC058965]|uniref:DUF4062 domain-containing protein n=1 Tax=Kitasatospora sp. NPDC058965 TaxID=3346682 RepID=UPI003695C1BD
MERRYQVFVSSTYTDLVDERREVIQALLELDCIPAGMEMFPAANDDQWTLIKRVIDDSDYYIVIIGNRYGSMSPSGVSYTEREYDYALSEGKPILGFVHGEPRKIEAGKSELGQDANAKLEEFREKVKKKVVRTWTTPDQLGSVVSRSLIKLMKESPGEGWVKGRNAASPELLEELSRLRAAVAEMKLARAEESSTQAALHDLAQGDELHMVHYKIISRGLEQAYGEIDYTWNDLFAILGARMMNEASDSDLGSALSNNIYDKLLESGQMPSDLFNPRVRITPSELDIIKVQLRALRLIDKGTKRRSVADNATYWKLTPYGDDQLVMMSALRKSSVPTEPGGPERSAVIQGEEAADDRVGVETGQ